MTIGAISFQPYVYNVNAVSPASMNRLSRISDNVLDKKTDFKGFVENENPLKKGQTLDFQGILEMQMQRGRSNAARIMKPVREEAQEAEQAEAATVKFERGGAPDAVWNEQTADIRQEQEAAAGAQPAAEENGGAGNDISNFRMQQAIHAYEMFMTA